MPKTKFPIGPGVFKDDTPLKAEGYAVDAQWMRWRRDEWEVIGGFQSASNDTFEGIVRGAHAWADLSGTRAVGFGTAANLYAFYGGDIRDITPLKAKGTLVDPFNTKSGEAKVIVYSERHGLKKDDVVTFALADAVGGITINGDYPITEILTVNSYFITHSSPAASSATGGGAVEYSVPLDVGRVDGIGGVGYGTGLYGTGPYGLPSTGDINPRVWSWDNWGHTGVAVPDNGALYQWQPQATYPELVTNGGFDTADDWGLGTDWSISGGKAVATAGTPSDLDQDLTGILSGGVTYVLSFDATVTAGGFQFRVVSDPGTPVEITLGETVEKSGSYMRRFTAPANPTVIQFAKDAAFAGEIDNVSIKVEDEAYRIMDAPPYSRDMFVDANRFAVLLGTLEQDGDFNSMLVRWCDQENLFTWDANSDNLAGEYPLGIGSEIRGGIASRGRNYVWTDAALYSMSFAGSSSDVFRFDLLGTGAGLKAKNAKAEFNGVVFWMGADDNFYLCQGGAPQLLECTLRKDVFDNLSPNQQAKVSCGINSQFGEVWWQYPDKRDGDGKECSRYVVYNWDANCWYGGKIGRSQWVDSGVFQSPLAFGLNGTIYYHDKGQSADGDALQWMLLTSRFDLGDGETLFKVMGFWPDFQAQAGTINLRVGFAQFATDEMVWSATYSVVPTTQKVDFRHMGRQMQLEFSGESAPAYHRHGSHRIDLVPSAARR